MKTCSLCGTQLSDNAGLAIRHYPRDADPVTLDFCNERCAIDYFSAIPFPESEIAAEAATMKGPVEDIR